MDCMDLEEEEEEDSGRMDSASASTSLLPSPECQPPPHRSHHLHHRHHLPHHRGGQAVGILSDEPVNGPQTLQVASLDGGDAHTIINEAGGTGEVRVGVGPVRVGGIGGVEDGIVSLEPNDDLAMGTPPGAIGAIGEGLTPRGFGVRRRRTTICARRITLESPTTGTSPIIPITPTTTATAIPSPTTTTSHTIFPTHTSNTSTSHIRLPLRNLPKKSSTMPIADYQNSVLWSAIYAKKRELWTCSWR